MNENVKEAIKKLPRNKPNPSKGLPARVQLVKDETETELDEIENTVQRVDNKETQHEC